MPHQLVAEHDQLGDVGGDDVAAADHVLGVVPQPAVRKELGAVVWVFRPLVRYHDVLHLRRNVYQSLDPPQGSTFLAW